MALKSVLSYQNIPLIKYVYEYRGILNKFILQMSHGKAIDIEIIN